MSRPAGAKLIVTRSADEKNHRSSKLKPDSNTVDLNWLWRSLLPCTRERRATLGTKLYKHWACFHLPDSEASPTLISMVPFCFSKPISLQGCFHSCMLYSTIFFLSYRLPVHYGALSCAHPPIWGREPGDYAYKLFWWPNLVISHQIRDWILWYSIRVKNDAFIVIIIERMLVSLWIRHTV